MQNGKIGVTTENIFPIIKKFLYSDHEIFLRELVSNAVDATQKLKTLASVGEFKGELGDVTIDVKLDTAAKTLTISDKGVGMTADEIEKYINQIAFSGAEEFMAKYENKTTIIGHFGLGFYSAFMVADKVEIVTRSYKKNAPTIKWSCEGSPEYTIAETKARADRGSDVILYIADDSKEFLEPQRIKSLLAKYCRFLPVPVSFEGKVVNDTNPLWTRKPADISEADYAAFYAELYPAAEPPLFNIHLNIDYPFNLTGILYFPKVRTNFEIQKNKIQLYSNQVFVTDSVEGIVPEFLTMLHGVIDSPDIPLNVSRSYLQSDSNVKKISSYITRKVADRLSEIFTAARADYESKWDDLKIFIQYGIVTDEKFAEKASELALVKNTEGKYFTLKEYQELVNINQTDKHGALVYLYTNDVQGQHGFIDAAKNKGYDVLVMDGQLDNHFIGWVEHKNPNIRLVRVDSDVAEKLIEKDEMRSMSLTSMQQEILMPVFESQLPTGDKVNYIVSFEPMDEKAEPVIITRNEYMRRMKDMSAMGGGMAAFYGQMPDSFNVAVNGNHPLVIDALNMAQSEMGDELGKYNKKIDTLRGEKRVIDDRVSAAKEEDILEDEKNLQKSLNAKLEKLVGERNAKLREIGSKSTLVKQLIDLALLSNGMLKGEDLTRFIRRSVELIGN